MRPDMMKRIVLTTIVAVSTVIGPSAYALDSSVMEGDPPHHVALQVTECNPITGANVQSASGGGVKIISLDAGGLFASVGLQIGDVILSVDGQQTNDTLSFCTEITSNKVKTVQLIVKDVNTGSYVVMNIAIPA
jgi:S1-C subfamily serine protease